MESDASTYATQVCIGLASAVSHAVERWSTWWRKWITQRGCWLALGVTVISELLLALFFSFQQVRKATLLGVSVRKLFPVLMLTLPAASLGLVYFGARANSDSSEAFLDSGAAYFFLSNTGGGRGFLQTHRTKVNIVALAFGLALLLLGAATLVNSYRRRTREYIAVARQHRARLFADPALDDVCSRGLPVRLLSYNICVRPPGVSGSSGDDLKDERLKLLLPELASFDIICFQELFDAYSNRRSAMQAALKEYGLRHHVYLPKRILGIPPKFVDGGVSIFSRFPIVAWDYIHYRNVVYHTIDALVGKGVLYARIELPVYWPADFPRKWNRSAFPSSTVQAKQVESQTNARYLHIFSTHMQAGDRPGYEPEAYHAEIRFHQAEEMRDFIARKVADDAGPVLITGDFNINARISPENPHESRWYRELMQRFGSAPRQGAALQVVDLVSLAHSGMHPITDDGKCIDYLLFDPRQGPVIAHGDENGAVRIYRYTVPEAARTRIFPEEDFSLSDHSAVLARLRIPVAWPNS